MKQLEDILVKLKSLHDSFARAMETIDREYDAIRNDPYKSNLAIVEARDRRTQKIRNLSREERRRLAKLREQAHEAVREDDSALNYSGLNADFFLFVNMCGSGLSANDFRILAQKNADSPTALKILKSKAAENGFILDTGLSAEKQLAYLDATIDRFDQTLNDATTREKWNNELMAISFANTSEALAPTAPEEWKCYKNNIEDAVLSDIQSKKASDNGAFEEGFTGKRPIDLSPEMAEIRADLEALGIENAEKIMDHISAHMTAESMSEMTAYDFHNLAKSLADSEPETAKSLDRYASAKLSLPVSFASPKNDDFGKADYFTLNDKNLLRTRQLERENQAEEQNK